MSSLTTNSVLSPVKLGGSRRRKHGKSIRGKRGGGVSAWESTLNKVGNMDSQINRMNEGNSNQLTPVQGSAPNHNTGVMKGGRKRSRKGGYWGQVISQALVPFGIWGLQNRFSKRRGLNRSHKIYHHRRHH